jgi:NTP pyrophosphatase (non-canonical NTP hydrolase)
MKPFNDLSPAEAERLAMLSEEAGEIVQIIGKIFRHGYDSMHPMELNTQIDNRRNLCKELGDLVGVMRAMVRAGELSAPRIEGYAEQKWRNALRYTHHQEVNE